MLPAASCIVNALYSENAFSALPLSVCVTPSCADVSRLACSSTARSPLSTPAAMLVPVREM